MMLNFSPIDPMGTNDTPTGVPVSRLADLYADYLRFAEDRHLPPAPIERVLQWLLSRGCLLCRLSDGSLGLWGVALRSPEGAQA